MFAFDKPIMWLVILVIVMVLFGASRLPELGKSLGRSINEFKSEMNSSEPKNFEETMPVQKASPTAAAATPAATLISNTNAALEYKQHARATE